MILDMLITNIPFIVVCIILIVKIITSVKRGIVKELCGLISIIFASIAVLLIAFAVRKFFTGERIIFVITLVLLFLLIIVYKIVDLALTTLKLVAKVPVVSLVNKLLAIPFAVAEVVIFTWAVYCMIMVLDTGAFEACVMNCVRNNPIMEMLYKNNYLYSIVANFSTTLHDFDIWGKLGM